MLFSGVCSHLFPFFALFHHSISISHLMTCCTVLTTWAHVFLKSNCILLIWLQGAVNNCVQSSVFHENTTAALFMLSAFELKSTFLNPGATCSSPGTVCAPYRLSPLWWYGFCCVSSPFLSNLYCQSTAVLSIKTPKTDLKKRILNPMLVFKRTLRNPLRSHSKCQHFSHIAGLLTCAVR